MPGRKYEAQSGYRYGFNGKEKDKNLNSLTAYDYGFRIYNPAIGKFLSVDPLMTKFPELTPYQFASNTPVKAIDLDGLEAVDANSNDIENDIAVKEIDENGSILRIYHNGNSTGIDLDGEGKAKISIRFPRVNFVQLAITGDYRYRSEDAYNDNVNDIFSYKIAKTDEIQGNYSDLSLEGVGNTFRHFLVAAVLTSAYSSETSKYITDGYELGDIKKGSLNLDNKVDLLNNFYGRQYAKLNKFDLRSVLNDKEKVVELLNNIASYILTNIKEYKSNPLFEGIISGKDKIFNTSQEGIKVFIDNLKKAFDSKAINPPPVVI